MTANTGTTSIRVRTDTRDRLNKLLTADYQGKTVDQLLDLLMDQEWKRRAIEEWDRFREEDPAGWRAYLNDAEQMDRVTANDGLEDEEPYLTGEEDWSADRGPGKASA